MTPHGSSQGPPDGAPDGPARATPRGDAGPNVDPSAGADAIRTERIDLGPDLGEVMRMNAWFDALAARLDLPAPRAGDIRLCLNEAVTNVLSYAYPPPGSPDDETAPPVAVSVTLRIAGDRVTAVIRDAGRPFDPTRVADPAPPTDIASAEIGGLGIKLMRDAASGMRHARQEGCNLLTLTFDLTGGS